MPAFRIQITTGASTPIYRQIVDQVRLAAATGEVPAGQPMPSVRSLAEQLRINFNTVAKAYAELVRDGVLESLPAKGFFVAEKRQVYSKPERLRRLRRWSLRRKPSRGCDHCSRFQRPRPVSNVRQPTRQILVEWPW